MSRCLYRKLHEPLGFLAGICPRVHLLSNLRQYNLIVRAHRRDGLNASDACSSWLAGRSRRLDLRASYSGALLLRLVAWQRRMVLDVLDM